MPSIEDADDFALDILRSLKNWAERALQRNNGIGHQGLVNRFSEHMHNAGDKIGAAKDELGEQFNSDLVAIKEDFGRNKELSGSLEQPKTPYKDLAFASEDDLAFVQNELARANIEHAFDPNCLGSDALELHYNRDGSLSSFVGPTSWQKDAIDGMYHIYVPDRPAALSAHVPFSGNDIELIESRNKFCRLENASEEMKSLMGYFEKDQSARRLALSSACQSAGSVAERSLTGDTFNLDFETVPWDRDASILSDRLDELNIPYNKEISPNGQTARFRFDKAYCPDVKEVSALLCASKIRDLNASRFKNLGELERTANLLDGMTAVQQHGPFSKEQAHLYTQMLRQASIPYETIVDKKTNQVSFLVKESDLSERAHIINGMDSKALPALDTLAQTQAKANQIAKAREHNTAINSKEVKQIAREEQQRKAASQTHPHKEQARAVRSAEAQKLEQNLAERVQNRSR